MNTSDQVDHHKKTESQHQNHSQLMERNQLLLDKKETRENRMMTCMCKTSKNKSPDLICSGINIPALLF